PPSSRFSKSIGHQHVLEPELRTNEGAHDFAQHLLTKAAERLRRGDYYCPRLGLHLSWVGDLGGWWDEITFLEMRDTGFLLGRLPATDTCFSRVLGTPKCRSWISGRYGRFCPAGSGGPRAAMRLASWKSYPG